MSSKVNHLLNRLSSAVNDAPFVVELGAGLKHTITNNPHISSDNSYYLAGNNLLMKNDKIQIHKAAIISTAGHPTALHLHVSIGCIVCGKEQYISPVCPECYNIHDPQGIKIFG